MTNKEYDLEEAAVEMTLKDMNDKLQYITTNLEGTEQTIPLYVFKGVFVDYFDIRVDLSDEKRENLFDMWVSKVATTVSSPVRIVDDEDGKTTLALVPPLIDTAGVSVAKEDIAALNQSVQVHNMKKDGIPELANIELNNSLMKTKVNIKDSHGQAWLKFYEFFDLPIALKGAEYIFVNDLVSGSIKIAESETVAEESVQSGLDLLDDLFG